MTEKLHNLSSIPSAIELADQASVAASQVHWLRHNPSTLMRLGVTLATTESIGFPFIDRLGIITPDERLDYNPGSMLAYTAGVLAVDRLIARPISMARQRRKFEAEKPRDISDMVPLGSLDVHRYGERYKDHEPELHLVWIPPKRKDGSTAMIDLRDMALPLYDAAVTLGAKHVAINVDASVLESPQVPGDSRSQSNSYYSTYGLPYVGRKRARSKTNSIALINEDPVDGNILKSIDKQMLIIPVESLRQFAEYEQQSKLEAMLAWVEANHPGHAFNRILKNHDDIESAKPALKRIAIQIAERQLFSSERRWAEVELPDGDTYRDRKRIERTGSVYTQDDTLRVQWRFADGKLDGSEKLISALDTSDAEQSAILDDPDHHHVNKALRAHELKILQLLCTHTESVEARYRKLKGLSGEFTPNPTLLQTMADNRVGTVFKRVRAHKDNWASNGGSYPSFRPNNLRRLRMLAAASLLPLTMGGLETYADRTYRQISANEDHENTSQLAYEAVYGNIESEYLSNPVFSALNKIGRFDAAVDTYASTAIVDSIFEFLASDEVEDNVDERRNRNRKDNINSAVNSILGLSGGVGNVGESGENFELIQLNSYGMDVSGYWGVSRFEAMAPGLVWKDKDEFNVVDLGEPLPTAYEISGLPSIHAYVGSDALEVLTFLQDFSTDMYMGIRLPVLEGTTIASASLRYGTNDEVHALYKHVHPDSGEITLFTDWKNLQNEPYLVYNLVEDTDDPLRWSEPVRGFEVARKGYDIISQPEMIAQARSFWQKYAPEVLDASESELLPRMLAFIQSGTYSLNPLKDGDLHDPPMIMDIVNATLKHREAVCNTANTTLVVSSPTPLAPISGFFNHDGSEAKDGSGFTVISTNEAHLWTKDAEGNTHDATPAGNLEFAQEGDLSKLNDVDMDVPELPVKPIAIGAAGLGLFLGRRKLTAGSRYLARRNAKRALRSYRDGTIASLYSTVNRSLYSSGTPGDDFLQGDTVTVPDRDIMVSFLAQVASNDLGLTGPQSVLHDTIRSASSKR